MNKEEEISTHKKPKGSKSGNIIDDMIINWTKYRNMPGKMADPRKVIAQILQDSRKRGEALTASDLEVITDGFKARAVEKIIANEDIIIGEVNGYIGELYSQLEIKKPINIAMQPERTQPVAEIRDLSVSEIAIKYLQAAKKITPENVSDNQSIIDSNTKSIEILKKGLTDIQERVERNNITMKEQLSKAATLLQDEIAVRKATIAIYQQADTRMDEDGVDADGVIDLTEEVGGEDVIDLTEEIKDGTSN